jgi:hypothetical protein
MLTHRSKHRALAGMACSVGLAVSGSFLISLATEAPAIADPCTLGGCGQQDAGSVPNDCPADQICAQGDGGNPGNDQNGAPPQVMDPAAIAQQQAPGLRIEIRVHTAPAEKTYTNLNTYLYLTGTTPLPIRGVTMTGETLVYTAKFKYADWNLGETNQYRCATPGSATDPSCSYIYQHSSPNGGAVPYQISATAHFRINWVCVTGNCTGRTGGLDSPPILSPPYNLLVGEIQNNTNG